MIKVIYGNKGIGKTKYLITSANALLKDCLGDVVFINGDNSLITDLRHEIRYINTSDFPIKRIEEVFAFICGIIAEDYDISAIYMDGLEKFDASQNEYTVFFEKLKGLSEKFEIRFIFTINGDISGVPEYVSKEYAC